MVMNGDSCILISQKTQDDPLRRTPEKNGLWVRKNAKAAALQLTGALRSASEKPIWCEHRRRGRVEFAAGLPPIIHGIVLIETREAVDLWPDVRELPLEYNCVPITYLSLNDFLNLVEELRSIPDLLTYLDARRALPVDCMRLLGAEKPLFEYYILNEGTLAGCLGHADAKIVIAARHGEMRVAFEQREDQAFSAQLLEYVGDCLAVRSADYAVGLSIEQLAAFDAPENRKNFLTMQDVIAQLTFAERAQLGRALFAAGAKLEGQMEGFVYQSAQFTSRDWVYVLCSSKNIARPEVLQRVEYLQRGAMAYYKKNNCMVIVDRDGEGYEIAKSRTDYRPTLADYSLGERYFAHLRSTSMPLNNV